MLLPIVASAAQTMDARTAKRLTLVSEHLGNEEYDQAKQILDGMTLTRLSSYERAIVFQLYGYLAASQEDYVAATEYFEKCVGEEALPEESAIRMRFNIAQLYMATERWADAVAALEEWFEITESANSVAYYTLAIAYYQNDQQDRALEPASQAVELAKKPKQRWLQLLLALRLERKEYRESLPVLEQLVSLYPKKSYWLQLAAIYNELEMEKESLAAQQLAHVQGLLTEDKELERLAQLYLYYDLPYRAALLMEKGLEDGNIEADEDSLELLANSLLTAKEYEAALEPLTRAAEFGSTGKLYTRLGQAHIQREEWAQADSALRKGLEKGGIDDPCRSQLLLGITSYNQQKVDAARSWFGRAAQTEECGPAATNWILHINRESPSESSEQGG